MWNDRASAGLHEPCHAFHANSSTPVTPLPAAPYARNRVQHYSYSLMFFSAQLRLIVPPITGDFNCKIAAMAFPIVPTVHCEMPAANASVHVTCTILVVEKRRSD